MSNEKLFLAWQNTESRKWTVIGQLTSNQSEYVFNYTKGAETADMFLPFSGMTDLKQTYRSNELFPIFQNRLLSNSRPEYPNFIRWLGLEHESPSPLQVLGRSGGLRTTDNLQTFCDASINEQGDAEFFFFVHGLRYCSSSANERVSKLSPDDKLKLALDVQNPKDPRAVLIQAESPLEILGYIPRYLCELVYPTLSSDPALVSVRVEQVSLEAPTQYRLMCKLTVKLSNNLSLNLLTNDEFQVIGS